MSTAVKEVRRRLKVIAKATTDEIYKVPPPERVETANYFVAELKEDIDDRELQEQIDAWVNEGGPAQD